MDELATRTRRPTMGPQNRLMLSLLKHAWPDGVHSLDLRRQHSIGDPGRRCSDLNELGHDVYSKPERRGKSNGCRYFIRLPQESASFSGDAIPPVGPGEQPEVAGRITAASGSVLEVDLPRLERACTAAIELREELAEEGKAHKPITLEDCVLLACSDDQQSMKAAA